MVKKLLIKKGTETPKANLKYIDIPHIKNSNKLMENDISGCNSNVNIKDSPSFIIEDEND